jgi:TetR/AcrR family transcriptional repressor of nem operon
MARLREFDTGSALDHVLGTFWAKGYEATSVDDLCAASGLSRSSLYSAFGDKRALLLRSLERYIDIRVGRLRDVMLGAPSLRDGLEVLTQAIIGDILAGPGRRGCFIGNCAAEIGRGDRKAMALVRKGMAAMEGVFREALVRARSRGELPEGADIEALARFLAAGFQGLRLVGKVNPDRGVLRDIAEVMLQCVRPVPR